MMKFFALNVLNVAFLLCAPCSGHTYTTGLGIVRRLEEEEVYDHILRCSSESYHVNLVAHPGPHFVIEAKPSTSTTSKNFLNCAELAFSVEGDGKKGIHEIVTKDDEEDTFKSSFNLGLVDLGKIFVAYETTETIPKDEYDMDTNNCVHFAAGIWRKLGFPETKELAEFLVDNIVGDGDRLKTFISSNAGEDHPARKALESGSIQSYYEDLVTSQLFIAN